MEKEEIVVRGYDLIELAQNVTYLDIVGLLLDGALPNSDERNSIEEKLRSEYGLPRNVNSILQLLPEQADFMDVLRTGISAIASYDVDLEDRSREANTRKAIRLLAKVPEIVANGYRAQTKQPFIDPRKDLSYTANFLYMITGNVPTKMEEAIFDQSLIVYSEHEMPNSTFAARVIASTQSDLYGALTGAVASLKGTLHGGANEAVMAMLLGSGIGSDLEALMLNKLAKKGTHYGLWTSGLYEKSRSARTAYERGIGGTRNRQESTRAIQYVCRWGRSHEARKEPASEFGLLCSSCLLFAWDSD